MLVPQQYVTISQNAKSQLPNDERLLNLANLAEEKLFPTPDHGDGISVVMKVPEIEHGLSDLPWHRDCGMGGHPLICPGLNIGIQLDEANEESGQLIPFMSATKNDYYALYTTNTYDSLSGILYWNDEPSNFQGMFEISMGLIRTKKKNM